MTMRCEAMQMERMDVDERFGEQAGDAIRRMDDIRRRRRREKQREEDDNENVCSGCSVGEMGV